MDMPPSRYRVEERSRRLVVIDRNGATGPAGDHSMRRPRSHRFAAILAILDIVGAETIRLLSLGATTHRGEIIITTTAAFDDRAPREIVLGADDARRVGRWTILAIGLAAAAGLVGFVLPELALAGFAILGLARSWIMSAIRKRTTAIFDSLAERQAADQT